MTGVLETKADWLIWLGPALAVAAVWLIAWRLLHRSPRRFAIAAVVVLLVLWPGFVWYFKHYRLTFETVLTLWPPAPAGVAPPTTSPSGQPLERLQGRHYAGSDDYVQWNGITLPPHRFYFLELEMSVGEGNLSRVEWAGPDGAYRQSQSTTFQGSLVWEGIMPRYYPGLRRYFVIIGKFNYPITGLRLHPSNAPADADIHSARVVALPM